MTRLAGGGAAGILASQGADVRTELGKGNAVAVGIAAVLL